MENQETELICLSCDHYTWFKGICFHPKGKEQIPEDNDWDKYPTTCAFFRRNENSREFLKKRKGSPRSPKITLRSTNLYTEINMGSHQSFLLTLLYRDSGTLLRCAITIPNEMIPIHVWDGRNEPESRAFFHNLLPLHCQEIGDVVEVENIFEAVQVQNKQLAAIA